MSDRHSTEMILLQILREVGRTRKILETVHGVAPADPVWLQEAIIDARDRELDELRERAL